MLKLFKYLFITILLFYSCNNIQTYNKYNCCITYTNGKSENIILFLKDDKCLKLTNSQKLYFNKNLLRSNVKSYNLLK